MIYVITTSKIYSSRSLADINRQLDAKIELDELHQVGADQIIYLDPVSLDFVQDKRKMSKILFGNFFKRDNTAKILMIINTILLFICMVHGGA